MITDDMMYGGKETWFTHDDAEQTGQETGLISYRIL